MQVALQIISQNYVVWNQIKLGVKIKEEVLQIISQNYVVWNIRARSGKILELKVANYITKLRGLKRQPRQKRSS